MFQARPGSRCAPPEVRTWSRHGVTPRVKVSGKGSGRENLAEMIAERAGFRTRLIYRVIAYHGRRHEARGYKVRDLAGTHDAAHQQLGRTPVRIWDNDTAHRDAAEGTARHETLTDCVLPAAVHTGAPSGRRCVWSTACSTALSTKCASPSSHDRSGVSISGRQRLRRRSTSQGAGRCFGLSRRRSRAFG